MTKSANPPSPAVQQILSVIDFNLCPDRQEHWISIISACNTKRTTWFTCDAYVRETTARANWPISGGVLAPSPDATCWNELLAVATRLEAGHWVDRPTQRARCLARYFTSGAANDTDHRVASVRSRNGKALATGIALWQETLEDALATGDHLLAEAARKAIETDTDNLVKFASSKLRQGS